MHSLHSSRLPAVAGSALSLPLAVCRNIPLASTHSFLQRPSNPSSAPAPRAVARKARRWITRSVALAAAGACNSSGSSSHNCSCMKSPSATGTRPCSCHQLLVMTEGGDQRPVDHALGHQRCPVASGVEAGRHLQHSGQTSEQRLVQSVGAAGRTTPRLEAELLGQLPLVAAQRGLVHR